MNTSIEALRDDEKGFTLVELAVVMIIIGLLIGGILKGQELITNARVTSTIGQLESMGAAYNGFIDKYNAIPGDMNNASGAAGRLANCGAPGTILACVNGNGDGDLENALGAAPAGETIGFFGQLLAANLITGMDGSAIAPALGVTNPTAPIGGGFFVGDGRAGNGPFPATVRPRPHLVINDTVAAAAAGTGALTPAQAATLDRRLDDGNVTSGSVVGVANAADCGAGPGYAEGLEGQLCAVAYRL